MKKLLLVSFALIFVLFIGLKAQNERINEENNNHELEHESNYHAGIFVGATSNLEHKTTDFSLGLDYEYKLDMLARTFGIGFFMEATFAEHKESLLGFPLYIHPGWGHFKLWLAPGVEFGDEPIKESTNNEIILKKKNSPLASESDNEETEFKTNFLFRIGMGYDFHFDMFAVSPAISVDMINGNFSFVYGLTFGMSF